jgi:hydroxymethylglutaryl-CoA lyase
MSSRTIEIVEVAPRDGLQSEDVILDTAAKLELIDRAVSAGITRIEVASFVNPKVVPQMADAEAVMAGLPRRDGVSYIGLVLNERGFQRALAAGVEEVNVVAVATDTFGQRNQGVTSDQSVAVVERVAAAAKGHRIRTTATVSTAFGCPYEGEVPVDRVASIAARCAAAGVDEVALADTIGVAVPTDVTVRVDAVRAAVGGVPLRAHFHNTRNTGLANAYAAVEGGVEALDASLGGIGGCPFAPNATGNIPTEDLAYLLHRMGVDTGIRLDELAASVPWLEAQLGKRVPGLFAKAGPFPRPAA